jgi:hypothetical protein
MIIRMLTTGTAPEGWLSLSGIMDHAPSLSP